MGIPFASINDVLEYRACAQPLRRAFAFLDGTGTLQQELTFSELDARARGIALALREGGHHRGRVVLRFPPGLDFITALFGCLYAGCVAVPTPHASPKKGIKRVEAILKDCQPTAILTMSQTNNDDPDDLSLAAAPRILVDTIPAAPGAPIFAAGPEDLALLQYTSGSTSAPKGVMISHANLMANNVMIKDAFGHHEASISVSWLPLFHDMGLVGHVLQPVYVGGFSVLMAPMTFLKRPLLWLKAISEWRATTSGAPSYAYDLCCERVGVDAVRGLDLSSWDVAYCGSERIRAETLDKFAVQFAANGFQRSALFPCYGLAEATLFVSGGPRGREPRTQPVRSVGHEIPRPAVASCGAADGSVAVVDPATCRPLDNHQIGEIWVKGEHVSAGYWQQPQATDACFDARLGNDRGYLRTGDLGFVADNELFVVGRIKETIVIRGANHAPEDIEATVAASHKAFAALPGAAFAVEHDGAERLVVVQEIARSAPADEIPLAIAAACENVTREHGLQLFDCMLVRPGTILRTSSGKIRRLECREHYQSRSSDRIDLREQRSDGPQSIRRVRAPA